MTGVEPEKLLAEYPESRARLLMNAALNIRLRREYHVPQWAEAFIKSNVSVIQAVVGASL